MWNWRRTSSSVLVTIVSLACGAFAASAQDGAAATPPAATAVAPQSPTASAASDRNDEGPQAAPEPAPPASPGDRDSQASTLGDSERAAAAAAAAAQAASSAPPGGRAAESLPHNLSPWGMFLAADWVVKAVMISLALASVLVWTAWIGKTLQVALARRHVRRELAIIEEQPTLAAADARLAGRTDPVAAMVRAATVELAMSDQGTMPPEGIKARIASRLSRLEAAAGRVMNSGTGLLATVGGTAPFIGLFGTVWGIMNSFIGISKAQTTNLAVVAPGIAEALLATAIGLVAAIPAVIFYNQLARSIAGYRAALADTAAAIERHASRDLDRRRTPRSYPFEAAE